MNQRAVLILSGYNNRGIIAFCRFCVQHDIAFYIIASGPDDSILLSGYKTNVIETRQSFELSLDIFTKYDKEFCRRNGFLEWLILPSTEFLNRFLLSNRETLEAEGFIIPLCSKSLYELLSDKLQFSEYCKTQHLTIPGEYDSIQSIRFPFVAKPKKYFSNQKEVSEKPIIVTNEIELEKLKKGNTEDFYFQEFIGGQSLYLLYYFSGDGNYSVFSQENLIQQYNGLSIIAARSAEWHRSAVGQDYAQLLLSLGYHGLIMIEVKFYKGQFYMIEANPRLWGPSQLILDAGMDLFDRFAADNHLISKMPAKTYTAGTRYFWQGGIIEDQQKNVATAFHNYEKDLFFDDYAQWTRADIYLRPDTLSVALNELKSNG